MISYKENLKHITTLIFDMDGVLTNGTVHLYKDEVIRNLSSKDSYAIQHAIKSGYKICIISGGNSPSARERFVEMGVHEVVMNSKNKLESFQYLSGLHNFQLENTLYMGDDLPDVPLLKSVRIATCPQDAAVEVKEVCHYVSHKSGGNGAVRDVIEQVMRSQNNWINAHSYSW
ncbi:MAG: HAD hydrolase family protein [Crocinitomicaceae bacterium]|jgi:3-deoxy-D-manno-octulosonate 8-phosphate phosphatase (KDO 8-P phosphatase)|nr:HAD hydrolase family protein [Crocinitomicaceae bacterium]